MSDAVIQNIQMFYRDEKNTRICPGAKEFVSIKNSETGQREHIQKQMLLFNLREIFDEWKKENPSIKIGFSAFANLRPKECVLAGSPGTHTVCVCAQHQNIKLKLIAISNDLSYKDLMSVAVCNTNNTMCMLHDCSACPQVMLLI